MGWGLPLFEISQGIPILRYQKTSKMAVSFSFSAYFPNTEILETRINPRFFALVLGQGFIFVQPSQVYLPKMMQVRKKPGIPGFFRVLRAKKEPSRRDVFE